MDTKTEFLSQTRLEEIRELVRRNRSAGKYQLFSFGKILLDALLDMAAEVERLRVLVREQRPLLLHERHGHDA